MNVALVGSNFALKGYLPALKKIKKLKLKIICSRNIKNIKDEINYFKDLIYEENWKNIFKKNINLIILAVPPVLQSKILSHNLKYKKKIIFEKPISHNLFKSKKIVEGLKKKKISCEVNLTYLNHDLFEYVKKIIKKKTLGRVMKYKILWEFVSYDLNKRMKSWKTDEKIGGGIKNIFLTHVFSYCEFFFGKNKCKTFRVKMIKFKNLNYKKFISCNLANPNSIEGRIDVFTKKSGLQKHEIRIDFTGGYIELFTKSKDWTKDFTLKIYNKNKDSTKIIKSKKNIMFKDGRCNQIYTMLSKFLTTQSYANIDLCLNAEKINYKIN